MMFDVQRLKQKLCDKGLVVAEDVAQIGLDAVVECMAEYAMETETPLDDSFVAGLSLFKPALDQVIDKIDGVEGK